MLLLLTATSVFAGSATWNLNPANGEWETATNWTPATIPNGPNDTATFRISNTTDIVLKNDASGVMTKDAQKWQMDEINKLVWGDPIDKNAKIGYMEPDLFKRGAETALKFDVIKKPAEDAADTHEIWDLATKK